jgi:hypothetical protein
MLVLKESKEYRCQSTASRESYSMVGIIERRNIRSRVHRWHVISEWWICPFLDGIRHFNKFSLVSTRWCQSSHQQCRTSLSSWRFRGEGLVEQISRAIWRRIFIVTNLTRLKPLRLFSVGVHIIPKVKIAIQSETENRVDQSGIDSWRQKSRHKEGDTFTQCPKTLKKKNMFYETRVCWGNYVLICSILFYVIHELSHCMTLQLHVASFTPTSNM